MSEKSPQSESNGHPSGLQPDALPLSYVRRMNITATGFEPVSFSTPVLETGPFDLLGHTVGERMVTMGFEPMSANTTVLKTGPFDLLGHATGFFFFDAPGIEPGCPGIPPGLSAIRTLCLDCLFISESWFHLYLKFFESRDEKNKKNFRTEN